MNLESDRFAEVVAAIGDGIPIEWDRLEREPADDEERSVLLTLRQVEAVARLNRAAQRPDGGGNAVVHEAWGPLLKLERLGVGSSGEVWRAFEPRLKREVALKLLSPESTSDPKTRVRLLEEGSHLARVRHSGVIAVHGIDEHDGRIGLWMELIDGETLSRVVERSGALSAHEAAIVGVAVCRSLAAIHAAGLVHRDIKPENILRSDGGRILVADFGLGQPADAAEARAQPGSGTPMYMSPEVLAGAAATSATDLYSLGVLLFYLVTCTHPHVATSLTELRESHRKRGGRRLRDLRPDLPPRFVETVEHAIDPEPGRRFQTAGTMESALLATVAGSDDPAAPVRAAVSGRRRLAGALLLVAAAACLILLLRNQVFSPPPGAPYDVEALMFRRSGDQLQPLSEADQVHTGDRLTLEITATRPLHVYVLNQDERGETFLLFPQPAYDQSNPLPAGRTHRLPGSVGGRSASWTVTSAGGREHFLVVASPNTLPDLERLLAALPAPRRGRSAEPLAIPLSSENIGRLRGVGGYALDSPSGENSAVRPLFDLVRGLAGKESDVRGVWLRQITLANPG